MTPEEVVARESIRHTMASYTVAGDRLRIEDFKAVFTEQAVLESEGVSEADSFRFEGREAIGGWLQRWLTPPTDNSAPKATFVRHHLGTCHIEFTGADSAKARTYWTAYTDIGPDHCGYYLDNFRRVGDEWLLEHRRVRLDWRSPQSLFGAAVARTR